MNQPHPNEWWHTPPPVCTPLLPVDTLSTKGMNPAWESAVIDTTNGDSLQCVFKYMQSFHSGKLPVELACALTGAVLGNNIPRPCLVEVKRGVLTELPESAFKQSTTLLFGSTYVQEGRFLEHLTEASDSTIDNAVWNHFCSDAPMAAKGAALDELFANWDRHSKNMRFDGKTWWLFDHDQALLPALNANAANVSAQFKGHANLIAQHLSKRRPTDHGMPHAARLTQNKHDTVKALAARAALWRHSNQEVQAIWHHTSQLIELLSRRLPMLQHMISARIQTQPASDLTWSSPPHKPAPPST